MASETAVDRVALLERLAQLRANGDISEEEFAAQKARVLGARVPPPPRAAPPGVARHEHRPGAWPYSEGRNEDASFGRWAIALAVALVVVAALAGGYWWLSRTDITPEKAIPYTVTGLANVRSSPTTEGSKVLGQLQAGEVIMAVSPGTPVDSKWLKIADGKYQGRYVWGANLQRGRSDGPNKARSATGAAEAVDVSPEGNAPVTATGTPEIGRCHMGTCSWSITKAQTVIRASADGRLIRLSLLGGEFPMDEMVAMDLHRSLNREPHITWDKQPHTVYIFCSTRLPTVLIPIGPDDAHPTGSLYAVALDFTKFVPGAQESSANLYARTCFPHDPDWTAEGFAARHSLPSVDPFPPDLSLNTPEDIFSIAAQRNQ